jgi:hypothetical protein
VATAMALALVVERWKWYRDGGVKRPCSGNECGDDKLHDALPRVVAAASEAAMRNGTDNDVLPRVLAAATEAVMTNGTDDNALPRVPVTDVAIEMTSAVGGWGMGNSRGFYFNFWGLC